MVREADATGLGGLSAADLAERRSAGSLLGLQAAECGDFAYQFERQEGQVRVKPALKRFILALAFCDPWSVAVLAKTPAPELDDATPEEWAARSDDEQRLLDHARILASTFRH